jgi:hypothetical protein
MAKTGVDHPQVAITTASRSAVQAGLASLKDVRGDDRVPSYSRSWSQHEQIPAAVAPAPAAASGHRRPRVLDVLVDGCRAETATSRSGSSGNGNCEPHPTGAGTPLHGDGMRSRSGGRWQAWNSLGSMQSVHITYPQTVPGLPPRPHSAARNPGPGADVEGTPRETAVSDRRGGGSHAACIKSCHLFYRVSCRRKP